MEKSPVFEKHYRDYLAKVAAVDIPAAAKTLAVTLDEDAACVPFFNTIYRVSAQGIADMSGSRPPYSVCITLCRYLILCPDTAPQAGTEWTSYRNFKDAAPFAGAFNQNTEQALARNFSGRTEAIIHAGRTLASRPPDGDYPYDAAMIIDALPRIPLLLLFNDADEDFPASCSILFERRAEKYMDMEGLAIIGWKLSDYLHRADGRPVEENVL